MYNPLKCSYIGRGGGEINRHASLYRIYRDNILWLFHVLHTCPRKERNCARIENFTGRTHSKLTFFFFYKKEECTHLILFRHVWIVIYNSIIRKFVFFFFLSFFLFIFTSSSSWCRCSFIHITLVPKMFWDFYWAPVSLHSTEIDPSLDNVFKYNVCVVVCHLSINGKRPKMRMIGKYI